MTAQEIQKRNKRAQQLRVIQTEDGTYFVESQAGKICYRVNFNDEQVNCSCSDYSRGIKKDPNFSCKHILATMKCLGNGGPQRATVLEKHKPKLDDRFIINLHGNNFVKYEGLLDLSHQRGLTRLEVEPIQYPTKENGMEAICRAIAETATGDLFIDIGDANPNNCTEKIKKHLLRMASTRCKARVLRDMNNIGMTALEELGDLDDIIGAPSSKKITRRKPATPKKTAAAEKTAPEKKKQEATESKKSAKKKAEPSPKEKSSEAQPKLSQAQLRAIANLSRRRGISEADLKNMVNEMFQVSTIEELASKEAATFIRNLQQAA